MKIHHTVRWRLCFILYSFHFSHRHINTQSRLQFHGIVVITHCDLPEPAYNQFFIKFGQFTPLLSNEVLQFLDTESIFPKAFDTAAQDSYLEAQDTFSSLFEDTSKYKAIMSALAEWLYGEFRNK